MHIAVSKTVSVLCLLLVRFCHGENSESKPREAIRQERTFKSSHSSGNLLSRSSSHSVFSDADSYTAGLEAAIGESCSDDDAVCLSQASEDRVGLEAIRSLHRQLDDDANGNVDLSESDEFLREELNYAEGHERRQQAFHRNNDKHISVKELWEAWIRSEVHNWTAEQTAEWLATNVELPQYIPTFIVNRVTGATLPRLAANNMHYLSNVLGIKDPIHKQKIALKAMDVVLFGPPKDSSHGTKDIILITLLLGALIGCYYAYHQNKNSKKHLKRMMKDMESLHKAELALDKLQKELEQARFERACVTTEKQNLEKQLLEQGCDNPELRTSYSDLEVSQLKAEIEVLRRELQRAEGELEDRCWSPPVGLQQWLQLTHEIENKSYIKKKLAAEKQLQQAREACEKLRKKRSSLVGAFVSTHGKSIDDVDRSIVEARTALNEVTQELKERVHRWKQIELLCGFNIINNSGLQYLENVLYRGTANGKGGSSGGLRGRMGSSHDDLDDDSSSLYSPSAGIADNMQWKETGDSSGSEAGRQEQDDDFQADSRSLAGNVHFTIGSDSWPEEHTSRSKSRSSMIRSYSQDTNVLIGDREGSLGAVSQSETCLDSSGAHRKIVTSTKRQSRDQFGSNREYIPQDSYKDVSSQESVNRDQITSRESTTRETTKEPTPSLDDETYSTDSNSTTEDDIRRRKRKPFFFSPRKPKSRMT